MNTTVAAIRINTLFMLSMFIVIIYLDCQTHPLKAPAGKEATSTQPERNQPRDIPETPNEPIPPKPVLVAIAQPAPPAPLVMTWREARRNRTNAHEAATIVCEPVVNCTDSEAVNFATGATRWLEFQIGGQPEMGRNPAWSSLDRIRLELHRPDFRLKESDIASVAKRIGATHFILCEVSGSARNLRLKFYLARFVDKKLIGKPIIFEGSQEAFLMKMPDIALEMTSRLGVGFPVLSAKTELSQAELQRIGRLPWQPDDSLPLADRAGLAEISKHSPLAAMLSLGAAGQESILSYRVIEKRLECGEGNTMPFAALSQNISELGAISDSAPQFEKSIQNLLLKYPNNSTLLRCKVRALRDRNAPEELEVASKVVKATPDNPEAWLTFGGTYGEMMEKRRYGRFSPQISDEEFAELNDLSDHWVACERRAVQLDPDFVRAWARLSCAATFKGDKKTAQNSMDTALKLDPMSKEAIGWALQMYQSKWYRNREKLLHFASLAPEAFQYDENSFMAAEALNCNGYFVEATSLANRILERQKEMFLAHPADFKFAFNRAYGLKKMNQLIPATEAFLELVRQHPDFFHLRYQLSELYFSQGRYKEAINELNTVLNLVPEDLEANELLGKCLISDNQPKIAIPALRKAILLGAGVETIKRLGSAYLILDKYAEAARMYEQTLKLDQEDEESARNWCRALLYSNQQKKAIPLGEYALKLKPEDTEAMNLTGCAYLSLGDFQKSEALFRKASELNRSDMFALEKLGNALIMQKKKSEARDVWNSILMKAPNSQEAKSAKLQLESNP